MRYLELHAKRVICCAHTSVKNCYQLSEHISRIQSRRQLLKAIHGEFGCILESRRLHI